MSSLNTGRFGRSGRASVLAAGLALAAPSFAADPITLFWGGSGLADLGAPSGFPLSVPAALEGSAHVLGTEGGWTTSVLAEVPTSGSGYGTFEAWHGIDRLAGSVTVNLARFGSQTGVFLYYSIEQAEGAWAGWTGYGSSSLLLPWPVPVGTVAFTESGTFTMSAPAVPEPPAWALALAGALGLSVRRRIGARR